MTDDQRRLAIEDFFNCARKEPPIILQAINETGPAFVINTIIERCELSGDGRFPGLHDALVANRADSERIAAACMGFM